MKIYSINELVKATNSFLKPETETLQKKNSQIENIKLPLETENIIIKAERTILDQYKKRSLLLDNKTSKVSTNNIDIFNYKIIK